MQSFMFTVIFLIVNLSLGLAYLGQTNVVIMTNSMFSSLELPMNTPDKKIET